MRRKIRVRRATVEDIPSLREVIRVTYSERGYVAPHEGDRITYPDPTDKRIVALVATEAKRIVGTISVQFGRAHSLPISDEFAQELRIVTERAGDGTIGHIGRLAVYEEYRTERVTPLLFRHLTLHCLLHNVCAAICIVNPRHEQFYVRRGFELIGRRDETPGLRNAPASFLAFYPKEISLWVIIRRWMYDRRKDPKRTGYPLERSSFHS